MENQQQGEMKIGLVVTTYNRPEYLKQCLESLRRANLTGVEVVIIDAGSDNAETIALISESGYENYTQTERTKIALNLFNGFRYLFEGKNCTHVMNLDGDALVRNDFMQVLAGLIKLCPDNIITGFHCTTLNNNGSERHKILEWRNTFDSPFTNTAAKESVGGINMFMSKETYTRYMLPALEQSIKHGGNWDHMTCINSMADNKPIICAVPSVIQHIGLVSSMGHSFIEEPDTAYDFKDLSLPDVTLVIVDCVDLDRAISVVNKSCKNIEFGAVKILTSIPSKDPRVVPIEFLGSKESYSRFMVQHIHKHIPTSHMLVIQHDGYVMNWKAWEHDWMQYDYIGATWWFNDAHNVGNGGFSLRSNKLMTAVSQLVYPAWDGHPEDDYICRTARPALEAHAGIKFAPEWVAERFSIEAHMKADKTYKGQFGFHGTGVVFPDFPVKPDHISVKKIYTPPPTLDTIIINQFFGLGDILFSLELVRQLYLNKGHNVIWPVERQYVNIGKHFPDITFVDKDLLNIDYNAEHLVKGNGYQVIPLRFTHRIMQVPFKDCMRSKYDWAGLDYKQWAKGLDMAQRDIEAQVMLYQHLGLKAGDKYILVNTRFRSNNSGNIEIPIQAPAGFKVVKMDSVEGFTLLDWLGVINGAHEIHTVSTSSLYLFESELINPGKNIHLYIRRPDEHNHDNYSYLLTDRQNYTLHT